MSKASAGWWVPGFGVIVLGCAILAYGIIARLRDPVAVIELVDAIVIAVFCFSGGAVMLFRHAPEPQGPWLKDQGPQP